VDAQGPQPRDGGSARDSGTGPESTIEKHVGAATRAKKHGFFVQCNIFYCVASKHSLYKGRVEYEGRHERQGARAELKLNHRKNGAGPSLRQEFRARG
jgi:hypothetical protein